MQVQNLNDVDVRVIRRRLPRRVVDLLRDHPGLIVAGGFVRDTVCNERPSDVDVFGPSEEAVVGAVAALAGTAVTVVAKLDRDRVYSFERGEDFVRVYRTDNAFTVRLPGDGPPVQLIHRWTYATVDELLASFDFTVAEAAVQWSAPLGRLVGRCSADFYPDLAARRLVYTRPQHNENAGGSMLRLLKFVRRGYSAPLDSVGAVVARLAGAVDPGRVGRWPSSYEMGSPERTASERDVAVVLTALLVQVDPRTVLHHPDGWDDRDAPSAAGAVHRDLFVDLVDDDEHDEAF